jgi:hypothetical protein
MVEEMRNKILAVTLLFGIYLTTSSLSTIVGKLISSYNPLVMGMTFANGADHGIAIRAYDDHNYNQRFFYVDPERGTSEYFSWSELDESGLEVFGIAYFLDGEW